MSVERGGRQRVPVVRPIYRVGDRVLVELPSGFYQMVVQSSRIVGGELWLDGKTSEFYTTFLAKLIVRRLSPGEAFTWPKTG